MQSPWQHGGPIQPAVFGAILRDTRLTLGRSLQDAERQTRILARHLAALENGDFHLLPTGIYARGFVYNYANWLQLNPQEMVRLFNEARGESEAAYRPQPVARPVNTQGPFSPNFVVIGFITVIMAVVAAWAYTLIVQTPPKKPIIDVPTVAATPTAIVGASSVATVSIAPSSTAGTIIIPSTTSGTSTGTTTTAVGATATATAASGLKVTLSATGQSWVAVYIDGSDIPQFAQVMNAGDTHDFDAKQSVKFIIGKPGSVSYSVNGQDKGTFPPDAYKSTGFVIKP